MLLNQCLAISLSPGRVSPKGAREQLEEAGYGQAQEKGHPASNTTAPAHKISQVNAAQLFEELVEQNSRLAARHIEHDTGPLAEVLARIEFAGFVVPSWLLLSGTFSDLHQLKTSWTRGRLRAPSGLRIETIGNIRSVNVDYLGEQEGATEDSQRHPREAESTAPEGAASESSRRLARLESAILENLARLEAATQDCGISVEASQLYANLEQRAELTFEPQLFERALERLVQTGRLKVAGARQLISIPTGRESVSSGSARSKSTTLDSGIQTTWNQHSAASSSAASPTASLAAVCEPPEVALIMVEKPAESASATLERARGRSLSSRRGLQEPADADCGRLEQVIIEDNQRAPAVQQPQRQQPEATKQQARRRGFSLTRSFSFHKQPHQQARQPNQSGDIERVAQEARKRTIESSEPERRHHTTGANLSSLFRSKSMRVVSTRSGQPALLCDNDPHGPAQSRHQHHQDGHQLDDERPAHALEGAFHQHKQTNRRQQATIDYLAGAQQHHKRSFSMRRNSLLAFGKEELGGGAGKIALFLRRLFNLRRPSRRQRHSNECQQRQKPANENDHSDARADLQAPLGRLLQVDIVHHHQPAASRAHSRKNGSNEWPPSGHADRLNWHAGEFSSAPPHRQPHYANAATVEGGAHQRHQLPTGFEHFGHASEHSPSGDSPDAPHESPPNSLIEILDCSPSLENSRRRLRQEEARNSSASRATWHLIKRSESSLSQQSNASASTNKSTVSQQLRRHLDEASKRHRDQRATSKRERDFIDSIQVLRQASRHASLENSRASSKNRQASSKSARSRKAVASSAPNTSDDSCSSIASDQPSRFYADDEEPELAGRPSAQPDLTQATAEGRPHEQHELSPASAKCEHESQLSSCCCLWPAGLPAPFAPHTHELYQLACCPVAQQASSQLACCPLAAGHQPPQPIALNQSPSHASGLLESSDLCCPIWRSIIYSYCQSQQPSAPLNQTMGAQQLTPATPTPQLPNVLDYQLHPATPAGFMQASAGGGDAGAELARSGHTFSASSLTNLQQQQLHQQQQHNTTIDLKIEIGAGLKKKLLGASGRTSASQRRAKQQAAAAAASSSSAITSDSLDTTSGSSSSSSASASPDDDDEEATASDCSSSSARASSSSTPLAHPTISRPKHTMRSPKATDGSRIMINANLCETGADDSSRALSPASPLAS